MYAKIKLSKIVDIHNLASMGRQIVLGGTKWNQPAEDMYIAAGWLPVRHATLTGRQKHGAAVVLPDAVEFPAVALDADELAAAIEADVAKVRAVAVGLIDGIAHWSSAPMVFDKSKNLKPKSKAIQQWVESVWGLFYQRAGQLEAGVPWSDTMLDFSALGPCPYKIKDAMME